MRTPTSVIVTGPEGTHQGAAVKLRPRDPTNGVAPTL